MPPSPNLHLPLDFETYCDLDLKKVGIHRYVEHPSFKVLCVAWKLTGQTVTGTDMQGQQALPQPLVMLLADPNIQAHAWNAAFETAVLERLGVHVARPVSCTMQRALAYGLPARLEAAGLALGLKRTKDMIGHRLMLRMSKPPKPGKPAPAWTPADFAALTAYCMGDVEAEEAVREIIPELQPEEWDLSQLDWRMNDRGVGLDLERVEDLEEVASAAMQADAARCAQLTGGAVTSPGTQTARLLKWLADEGITLPDVARATVEDALETWGGTVNWDVISEVLRIRLRAARGSTRKLARMRVMSRLAQYPGPSPVGLLQGQFQFCGAGRTGRWSGRGVQVQNLPRIAKGFSPDTFAAMAENAVLTGFPEGVDMVASAPVLDCVAWSLRSCFVPRDYGLAGSCLWGFDFSQIEARVLAWLAGQQDVLDVFRRGEDVYVWAAEQFGSKDRQLGKVLILALGFGMGATKLRDTARKSYGVLLTMAQAEAFKTAWRHRNRHIVAFWYAMEDAAKRSILQRGQVFAVGGSGIAFTCTSRTLQMRLPSGRVLYYHKPRLDPSSGSIVYEGPEVGGRWVEQRTYGGKLAENATQAAARDIMGEAMLRVWRRRGMVPVMSVHDEIVYEVLVKTGTSVGDLERIALESPPWAGGLPIAGEAKIMTRYGVQI